MASLSRWMTENLLRVLLFKTKVFDMRSVYAIIQIYLKFISIRSNVGYNNYLDFFGKQMNKLRIY